MRVLLEVIHHFPFSMQAYLMKHCEPNNDDSNYNALLRLILLIYIIRVVGCSNFQRYGSYMPETHSFVFL